MDESINTANKKQSRQKPPLSIGRIACEILAGSAVGFAIALPITYVIGNAFDGRGVFGPFSFQAMFLIVFRPLYGLASAVGVYLVGNEGNETGSFLPTLGWGFVGGLVMLVIPVPLHSLLAGIEKIVPWAIVLLIGPIVATLGFNITRRYKELPSFGMENEQNQHRCSIIPLICSIVPIVVTGGFLWLVDRADPHILRPRNWGEFGGLGYGPVLLCVGILVAVVTIPPGIYSLLSGVAAVREPEVMGKTPVVFAIALGIFDIMAGTGYLFWTFSKFF